MEVNIKTIIAFLLGAGILGIIVWITKTNNGVVAPSALQDIVYQQQSQIKGEINNIQTSKTIINDYVNKMNRAADDMSRLPFQKYLFLKKEDATFDSKSFELRNVVDGIRNVIYRYPYGSNADKSLVDKSLDEASISIDEDVLRFFRSLYDYISDTTKGTVTRDALINFLSDSNNLRNATISIAGKMKTESSKLDLVAKNIDKDVEKKGKLIEAQNESLKDVEKSTKDRLMMVVVLPIFAIIIVMLFVIPYLYRSNDAVMKLFFEDKIILQVFTVFIMVIAILLLGIGDKIKAETLGTLLGGISVYVLQNVLAPNGGKPVLPPAPAPAPPAAPVALVEPVRP